MKGSAIVVFLIGVGLLGAFVPRAVHAQTQRGVYSPFDKDDPEIQQLKKLDWKTADFEAQDLKTRCTALLALQNVLSMTGGKASDRLELLVDYVDQNKLGETFASQQESIPPPPQISYEDAKKIATAFVTSDVGRDKFGQELTGAEQAAHDQEVAKLREVVKGRRWRRSATASPPAAATLTVEKRPMSDFNFALRVAPCALLVLPQTAPPALAQAQSAAPAAAPLPEDKGWPRTFEKDGSSAQAIQWAQLRRRWSRSSLNQTRGVK